MGQELGHLQKRFFLFAVAIFVQKNNLASGDRAFATRDNTHEYTCLLTKNKHRRPQESHASHFLVCFYVLKVK